jgi:hypothetical protein
LRRAAKLRKTQGEEFQMAELDDQAQTRLTTAALFAALVKALEKRDVLARSDFANELDKVCREIANYPANAPITFETLNWTSELLK